MDEDLERLSGAGERRAAVILGAGMARVTLYSRPGCRLCEEAMRELRAAVPGIVVNEVDVDSEPSLRDRYGLDIPVAVENGLELFRHRFDSACIALIGKP